ncbi:MAG: hypothetical protein M3N19_12440, partial [Candidatus Eremiobacteraeota bacterium]|nr:hypothetical protein [Candidatus Eremiobacteraeota bacterium]
KRLLGNPFLVFCSLISYNWYIYHQVLARELWWHHLPPWTGTDSHFDPNWQFWYSIIAFPLTIGVAALVTFLFERPILRIDPARWQR